MNTYLSDDDFERILNPLTRSSSLVYRILSIDGGGIRGIIPARILAEIEMMTGKRIAEMFDLICGTSTGGIIALGLVYPNKNGKPKYTAVDLLKLYEKYGTKIFPSSLFRQFRDVQNYYQPKYSSSGLVEVVDDFFKKVRLKHALREVLIPSYEIERRIPFFFKSRKAKKGTGHNFFMRDVALATTAAPTYFPPHQIFTDDLSQKFVFIDGGVYANNPTLCGYAEAKKNHPEKAREIFILSLGTGEHTTSLHYEDTKDWGQAGWARSVIEIASDGVSNTVHYQMKELNKRDDNLHYYRLQVRLDKGDDTLDNASEENTFTLLKIAEAMIHENLDLLGTLNEELLKVSAEEKPTAATANESSTEPVA
jgi:hypothetical protein